MLEEQRARVLEEQREEQCEKELEERHEKVLEQVVQEREVADWLRGAENPGMSQAGALPPTQMDQGQQYEMVDRQELA